MTERKTIVTKLIATHVVLLPALLMITAIFGNYEFLLLGIDQTILFILFFAGYWEFFGLLFNRIFLVLCQIIILVLLSECLISDEVLSPNITGLLILSGIELYLLVLLVRILIVIYYDDNEKLEISIPFKNGCYLITDGGNSKVSHLMNYHFHSRIHKRKKQIFPCCMLQML